MLSNLKETIFGFLPDNNYLEFIVLLVLTFVALRLSVFIIEKIVLKLTAKTKTEVDDLIVARTSKPLTFLVLIVGIKFALSVLPFSEKAFNLIHQILSSLVFVVCFLIAYRIFFILVDQGLKHKAKRTHVPLNEGLFNLIIGTIKVLVVITCILSVLSFWGVEIGPVLAGLGIGGIAIGLALQPTLSNLFGGISMILDKSVRVGDVVDLGAGVSGKILKIGLRSTKIRTFDNELMIVPNSKLSTENIHNIAQPEPQVRVVIPFGVSYGSDVEKVKKIVLSEVKKVANLKKDMEPYVKFIEMGASSLNFKAYFFVESFENRFDAIDEANTKIYNALNKAGIEIPFPQMDVHLKK